MKKTRSPFEILPASAVNQISTVLLAVTMTIVVTGINAYSVPARAQVPTGQPAQPVIGQLDPPHPPD